MKRVLILTIAILGVACGSTTTGADELPEAVRPLAEGAEVTPFTGWSVPGLRLYRVAWAASDLSSARVVGVDGNGARVEGPALMRALGPLPPETLARRAFDVLLAQQGGAPLMPGPRTTELGTEELWAAVTAPHLENGVLVFFAWRGEMSPELVEHRLDPTSFELSTRTVAEMLAARGEVVRVGEPLCMAFARCGCWSGCARVEPVRAPEGNVATHRLVEALPNGEEAGALLYVEEHCYEGRCQRVCIADTAGARCDDGGLSFVNETCTGACAPSEAPYHCVTYADRCERVEHPHRAPAPP